MNQSDAPRLIDDMNRLLAKEHGCAIRYATHAVLITGPFMEPVSKRLLEIASDEIEHAAKLRARICALGGVPTMKVDDDDDGPSGALTVQEIIRENILEETVAINEYQKLLESVPPLNLILRRAIEDILRDEQEHREELIALMPSTEENRFGGRRGVRTGLLAAVSTKSSEQISRLDSRD